MATRLVIRGKTAYANLDHRKQMAFTPASRALPRNRQGDAVDSAAAIPGTSAKSPYSAGQAFKDPEEGVMYRMVRKLDPLEGWATTAFWQKRWEIEHQDVLKLVEHGMLDAAIEQGSQIRRYRCRDEPAVLKHDVYYRSHERQGLRIRRAGKSLARRLGKKTS